MSNAVRTYIPSKKLISVAIGTANIAKEGAL
jgi:hypothetical protein